jgi:hypothetical protein
VGPVGAEDVAGDAVVDAVEVNSIPHVCSAGGTKGGRNWERMQQKAQQKSSNLNLA